MKNYYVDWLSSKVSLLGNGTCWVTLSLTQPTIKHLFFNNLYEFLN